jgi:hypothetical protein
VRAKINILNGERPVRTCHAQGGYPSASTAHVVESDLRQSQSQRPNRIFKSTYRLLGKRFATNKWLKLLLCVTSTSYFLRSLYEEETFSQQDLRAKKFPHLAYVAKKQHIVLIYTRRCAADLTHQRQNNCVPCWYHSLACVCIDPYKQNSSAPAAAQLDRRKWKLQQKVTISTSTKRHGVAPSQKQKGERWQNRKNLLRCGDWIERPLKHWCKCMRCRRFRFQSIDECTYS